MERKGKEVAEQWLGCTYFLDIRLLLSFPSHCHHHRDALYMKARYHWGLQANTAQLNNPPGARLRHNVYAFYWPYATLVAQQRWQQQQQRRATCRMATLL